MCVVKRLSKGAMKVGMDISVVSRIRFTAGESSIFEQSWPAILKVSPQEVSRGEEGAGAPT